MTEQEFDQCKICWDAFVALSENDEHRNTVKKAEMMVKQIGAMATYALCGFENQDLPEQVKQIIADGLMYIEVMNQKTSASN